MKLLRSFATYAALCLALALPVFGQTNPGTSPLSIAKGGTGATSTSAARTALGLAIGTNVQAFNARLADMAGASWVQGDVVYFNGSNLVRLPPGTSGHFLKTNGSGANPAWAAASGGSLSDGDKGDITVSSSGATWTIDALAVTYAKMQNISATQRVLGRNTAGAGATEEVTATQLLDWIGSTRGSILYKGASGWAALTPGTSGFFLKSNGSGADPAWDSAAGAGGSPFTTIEFRPTGSVAGDYFELTGNTNGFMTAHMRPVSQGYGAFDLIPNHSGGVVNHTNAGRMWMDITGADGIGTPGVNNWAARMGAKVDGGSVDIGYIGTWKNAGHATTVPLAVILDTSTEVARFNTTGFTAIGTTTNDNAAAGYIGEYVSSTVLVGSAVSLTTATAANVTSISLTAGDWDVSGNVAYFSNTATVTTQATAYITTTSATSPTIPNGGAFAKWLGSLTGVANSFILPTGTTRLSLSATTTVYLGTTAVFTTNTNTAYGFIGARRVR